MLGLATLKQEGTHNKRIAQENTPNPRFSIQEQKSAREFASRAIQLGSGLGNRLVLYTDATHLPTRKMSGMAVVYKHFWGNSSVPTWVDKAHATPSLGSSCKAEALAIRNALEIALAEVRTSCGLDGERGLKTSQLPRVMIFTDAQGPLRAFQQYLISGTTSTAKLTSPWDEQVFAQARESIYTLEEMGVHVELHWVPGHISQVEGNCRAHRLARHVTDALECIVPDHPVRAHSQYAEMLSIEEIQRRRQLARQLELFQRGLDGTGSEVGLQNLFDR